MQLSSAAIEFSFIEKTLDLNLDSNRNLKYISNDELLFRTENIVRTERKIMYIVLVHILEIMNRRLYADLGFDSMYTMMTKKFGYSEASAIRRIDAAKLLRSVPEVAGRLKSGTSNLSQACLLQKCLESDAKGGEATSTAKTQAILEKLEDCNSFETRQILAQEFNMPIKIQEIVRPQKNKSVRLEITFTKEQFEELKQAKSFLSHVIHNGSWAEVISALASKLNQSKMGKTHKSPGPEKPKLGSATEFNNLNSADGSPAASTRMQKPISAQIKRQIFEKAQEGCQFKNANGVRCGSKYQVQFDHMTPVKWGGSNKIDNLQLLCRTHNLFMARQMVL